MPLISRIALLLVLAALSAAATAQDPYPARPIRMIITSAPASADDVAARALGTRMSENMRQPFAIENVPGASGLVGAERLAKSAPDGYTIGAFNDSVLTVLPNLRARLPFDVLEDFEPVSLIGTVEWGLVASNAAPYRSANDLIAAATARRGKIRFASGGNGSPEHIAMAALATTANLALTHVPYKNGTQAANGIAAGHVPVGMQGLDTAGALVRAGKVRLIGVAMPQRHPQFPGVATVADSGLPGFTFASWLAIVAPAGTPKDIVVRLNAEISRALASPEVRENLTLRGFTVRGTSQDELASIVRAQLARYARVMKAAGIKAE